MKTQTYLNQQFCVIRQSRRKAKALQIQLFQTTESGLVRRNIPDTYLPAFLP